MARIQWTRTGDGFSAVILARHALLNETVEAQTALKHGGACYKTLV